MTLKKAWSWFITPDNFFFLSALLLAVSLPLSKFTMSIAQIGLGISWLLYGNYKVRLSSVFKNKLFWALSSIFLIHLIGLIYTQNFDYALNDIKIKLPLFILPFIFLSTPLLLRFRYRLVLKFFVIGILIGTLLSFFKSIGWLGEVPLDKRELSLFISHIRFSLMICVAFFCCVYLFSTQNKNRIFWLFAAAWLIISLFILGSITGIIVILFSSLFMLSFYFLNTGGKKAKFFFPSLVLFVIAVFVTLIYSNVNEFYTLKNQPDPIPIEKSTLQGEEYAHTLEGDYSQMKENGYFLWRHIAWQELEDAWNTRSSLPFDGMDKKNQPLKETLVRFLTSKGLKKDADGVNKLSEEEVTAIENGTSNHLYLTYNPLKLRVQKIIWEFDNYFEGGNYNGHSVVMRLAFFENALHTWKRNNSWIGVGTGDIRDEIEKQYQIENSILSGEYRLRAHNQFLTFLVSFGIIGLLIFIFSIIYPLFKITDSYLYISFVVIAILSMFTEDTLESQAGVTFFAFLNIFLLLLENRSLNSLQK